jgi:hypothetical protein
MTTTNTELKAPVPTEQQVREWQELYYCDDIIVDEGVDLFTHKQAAAWGYEQARTQQPAPAQPFECQCGCNLEVCDQFDDASGINNCEGCGHGKACHDHRRRNKTAPAQPITNALMLGAACLEKAAEEFAEGSRLATLYMESAKQLRLYTPPAAGDGVVVNAKALKAAVSALRAYGCDEYVEELRMLQAALAQAKENKNENSNTR